MSEAVQFPAGLIGDGLCLPPDQILEAALGKYASVVLVGETDEGEIEVCGSHGAADSMMLLAWAQNFLVTNRVVR